MPLLLQKMNRYFLKHYKYIILLLINSSSMVFSQPGFDPYECIESGNYTKPSGYEWGLNFVLSSLSSRIDEYGFVNYSYSQGLTTINAVALCRGDINIDICRQCVSDATVQIKKVCPYNKEAVGVNDGYCLLRYSNRSIYGILEKEPVLWQPNNRPASNQELFNKAARELLDNLTISASNGGDRFKFATGKINGPDFLTIYGLTQCTPDISKQDCNDCLVSAVSGISEVCCSGKEGGRVFRPSCYLRYEKYSFLNKSIATPPPPPPPPPSSLPPTPSEKGSNNGTRRKTVRIIVASTNGLVILLSFFICFFLWKRKQKKAKQRLSLSIDEARGVDDIDEVESFQFEFSIISYATENFSNANKLGQGGFGAVYKGKLQNQQDIAVKRLSRNSGQGEHEFKNEVTLLAKLQHRNLVRLLGFSLEGEERLLVYEFVTNSSLDQFIFNPIKRVLLNWDKRRKIIIGVAKGLLYLHEDSRLRIIHCDMKASNVLLDGEMNPKIADFGLAKLFARDETHGRTYKIAGTRGYMAPEYALRGHFSVKSDVYSYGVLILEIVAGLKNSCFGNGDTPNDLLSSIWKSSREGNASSFIDPALRSTVSSTDEIMRCIQIGLLCVQEYVADRPTMASVVIMLSSSSISLPIPSQPGFYHGESDLQNGVGSISTYSHQSGNQDTITELYPR